MRSPSAYYGHLSETVPVDDDLMEALQCMLPESQQLTDQPRPPSGQLDVDAMPVHPKEVLLTGGDVDDMLLSLEGQDFSAFGGLDKAPLKCRQSPSELCTSNFPVVAQDKQVQPTTSIDRRLKPNSTSKRRNRRRPKHELDYLRAKVVELQEELATLSTVEVGSPDTVSVGSTLMNRASKDVRTHLTAVVTKDARTECSSWKEIAERQKNGVDNSIVENRKLRNKLLGQLQVARVLEAAIKEHQKEAPQTTPLKFVGNVHRGVRGVTTSGDWALQAHAKSMLDDQVFALLNDSLNTQYAEVDTVLTTGGLSNVLHELKGGFQFKREASGISFRHEEARLLPFSMHLLHHTLWDCLRNGAAVQCPEVNTLSSDHLNLIFHDTLSLPKSRRVSVTKRAAFRRYFEQDRIIFVWCSVVEIEGSGFVRLREKGWSTTSTFEFHRGVPVGANSSSNYVQGCITRMAIQMTPEISSLTSEQEARLHIGEVTDLVVGTYQHEFGMIHDVVENLLLKDDSPVKTNSNSRGDGSNMITSQ